MLNRNCIFVTEETFMIGTIEMSYSASPTSQLLDEKARVYSTYCSQKYAPKSVIVTSPSRKAFEETNL